MASVIVLDIIEFQSVGLGVRIEDIDVLVRLVYAAAVVLHVIALEISQWTRMHVIAQGNCQWTNVHVT